MTPAHQMLRMTSFPVLLLIAAYERQVKRIGAVTFNETVSAATERMFETLPRALKRLSKPGSLNQKSSTY